MLSDTDLTSVEWIFAGDGPGQPERWRIGSTTYVRGELYTDVPPRHLMRGGFHQVGELDGSVVLHRRPVKRGIILGTAPSMWTDLLQFRAQFDSDREWDLIAVNGAGFLYEEPIDLWVSVHGNHLVKWVRKRHDLGYDMDFAAYGNFGRYENIPDGITAWNKPHGNGSSGLFAVLVALELGYERLVLCGVPLEGQRRYGYGNPNDKSEPDENGLVTGDTDYKHYRTGWYKRRGALEEHVRSMGGWTAEYLGEPTDEWVLEPTWGGTHERLESGGDNPTGGGN